MKLGSLFDGSGGFPLAGSLCGITPVWASEVEPYPIAVTRSRFPGMKHLGSVTEIRGGDIEPVDVITFGSPCQDLSVAGKRKGLKHEAKGDEETTRSGLFLEAVRIIREMRDATHGVYPRFALWENVPGAFSSNAGEDFRTVLEQLIQIPEPDAVMPPVPKGGWAYADCFIGDGWSIAYRTLDAQYWGVPQRRRRIYLAADFGGQRAGEILFKCEGLRGYFETGRTPWKGASSDAETGAGADDHGGAHVGFFQNTGIGWWNESGVGTTLRTPCGGDATFANVVVQTVDGNILDDQGGQQITVRTDGKAPTLRVEMHGNVPCVIHAAGFCQEESAKTRGVGYSEEQAPTLRAGVTPAVVCKEQYLFENHSQDTRYNGPMEVCPMLPAQLGTGGNNQPFVVEEIPAIPIHDKATRYKGGGPTRNEDGAGNGLGVGKPGDPVATISTCDRHMVCYCMAHGQANAEILEDKCPCLNCNHEQPIVAVVDCRNGRLNGDLCGTLQEKPNGGFSYNCIHPVIISYHFRYIVRRLTPTECARLQGFPDYWGHPDRKDGFTDEEYGFWLKVRNTHAAINGKPEKRYTREQIVSWYNKLHTDSSEYKMWGNGIALPTALYVMQGIAEALETDNSGEI